MAPCCCPQEDADHTIKPFVHHSHAHRESEQQDDDEEINAWNLRKCSAAGLDVLSTVFNDDLLPVLMPIIKERLMVPDWRARESAVLALGAISEGCHQGLRPHLQEIVTTMLPLLDDPKPLVSHPAKPPLSAQRKPVASGQQQQQPFRLNCHAIIAHVIRLSNCHTGTGCMTWRVLHPWFGCGIIPDLGVFKPDTVRSFVGQCSTYVLHVWATAIIMCVNTACCGSHDPTQAIVESQA